jgi:hypothetical protein
MEEVFFLAIDTGDEKCICHVVPQTKKTVSGMASCNFS